MFTVLVAQIGFSSWMMLAWGAAAVIPIAIHLLRKRRRVTIRWAAMQLLQKVIDQQSKRSRIQQLILLLLRIAALLLFALAIARPFLQGDGQSNSVLSVRPSKVWIMLVDTSYSMGYQSEGSSSSGFRTAGQSRMDRAKQLLSQLVNESQAGDAFALVVIDDPSRPVIGIPSFDAPSTQAEIQRLSESACGSDLNAALSIANDIAADCKANASLPQDIEVVIVSDLGSDAWQSLADRSSSTGSTSVDSSSLARLSQLASVRVEPIQDANPTNVAIEAVTLATNRPTTGSILSVDITVASYGASVKQLPVQLEVDGQVVASDTVDIDAGSKRQVQLQATIQSSGSSVLSAVIPADNLTIDNRRDVVIEATQGDRVLIVQKNASIVNPWQIALRTAREQATGQSNAQANGNDSRVRTVSELSWGSLSLKEWDVLLLDDITIAENQIARITGFVEAGGSVIFTWGSHQSLSQLQTANERLKKLLGFEFRSVSDEADWTIDPMEYRSPVVAPFSGFPNAGLLTTPIFRYWQVNALDPDVKVDLSVNSGDPLLVRNRVESGWVASLLSAPQDGQNSPANVSWNAITTWPSFLPVALQLVQTVSDVDSSICNRQAGQSLSDRLPPFSQATSVKLQRPDQKEVSIAAAQTDSSDRLSWTYSGTELRGVYRTLEPKEAQRQFAVNIDPIQSSLKSIDLQAIRPLIQSSLETSSDAQRSEIAKASSNDSLSRAILITLIVVLLSESLLAWSLGKQAQ